MMIRYICTCMEQILLSESFATWLGTGWTSDVVGEGVVLHVNLDLKLTYLDKCAKKKIVLTTLVQVC